MSKTDLGKLKSFLKFFFIKIKELFLIYWVEETSVISKLSSITESITKSLIKSYACLELIDFFKD